jgi:hypothetical protein
VAFWEFKGKGLVDDQVGVCILDATCRAKALISAGQSLEEEK